jgi:tetratricopeptide (TPR) repeat protein
MARAIKGRVLHHVDRTNEALALFYEAGASFEALARPGNHRSAEEMAAVCLTERAGCLRDLGRLDEAAACYEASIRLDQERGAERSLAVNLAELAALRLKQRRFDRAIEDLKRLREYFATLPDIRSVGTVWLDLGNALLEIGNLNAAEDALRNAVTIFIQLGDVGAHTEALISLGNLYVDCDRHRRCNDVLSTGSRQLGFVRQARKTREGPWKPGNDSMQARALERGTEDLRTSN